MKRVLTAFLFMFLSAKLYAFTSNPIATNFIAWRATETCTAETNVLVTTGVIVIHSIKTTSGTADNSSFIYFNSTTTDLAVLRTTSTYYNTKSYQYPPYIIDDVLNKGFLYSTQGTNCLRVEWDYYGGFNVFDSTQTNRGRK